MPAVGMAVDADGERQGRGDDGRPHRLVAEIATVMLHRAVGEHGGGDHPGRAVQPARGAHGCAFAGKGDRCPRNRPFVLQGLQLRAQLADGQGCPVLGGGAQNAWPFQWRQERKRSFLKKRTKRLVIPGPAAIPPVMDAAGCAGGEIKVFCFFFCRISQTHAFNFVSLAETLASISLARVLEHAAKFRLARPSWSGNSSRPLA